MTKTNSTKENINKLIEFRQAVFDHAFVARRDALFDLLDALIDEGQVSSFARLSQSDHFRRQWSSLYAAIEDGRLNEPWLCDYLAQRVPEKGIHHFALDGSSWPRPRSRTLADRQYVYQASSDVNGGTVTIGYPYSCLEWVVESHSSWSLGVNVQRVSSDQKVVAVGARQIQGLAEARKDLPDRLDIVACDGKYGHAGFLRLVKGLPACGVTTRLRRDRVLYRAPIPRLPHQRGRSKRHGPRFAFKEPDTWGIPDESLELEDPFWGRVRLARWSQLHEKKGTDVPYDVIRARVHQEREHPPAALWLAWLAPQPLPILEPVTVETIWRAYDARWPIEPGLHFRKATLGWTLPRFQSPDAGDRWTWLTTLGVWLIYLAGSLVADSPLPWQKPQTRLTPQRVQQSFQPIFALIGTPAGFPKQRGIATGWPKGRRRMPKPSFPVVKKTPKVAKTA